MASKTEAWDNNLDVKNLQRWAQLLRTFFGLNKSFFENSKLKVFRNETIVEMILTCENK